MLMVVGLVEDGSGCDGSTMLVSHRYGAPVTIWTTPRLLRPLVAIIWMRIVGFLLYYS